MLGEMAGDSLSNLAQHPPNRTLMYRAELQLKTAALKGAPVLQRGSLSPRGMPLRTRDSSGSGATSPKGIDKSSSSKAGSKAARVRPSAKQRFVDWLCELDASEALEAQAAEELAAAALGAAARSGKGETPHRVLLARAAFSLMDANEARHMHRNAMT